MGANIGSTMTAQLLAFNISAYALLPVAIGFFITFTAKTESIRFTGMMAMGLGLGSLWVFGYPFGFMAIIGSMGLRAFPTPQ